MVSQVREYIRRQGLIKPGEQVVAGISGGADSVCLLFLLDALQEELSFSLTAVHVEHGLRGEESRKDAAFVEELCGKRGIPCRIFSVDVPKRVRETGLSVEEAGRELRYACFFQALKETGADKIAVAHHRDDQTETMLFHLFRGTGLRGLCGMAPMRGQVIRPLLEIGRREIEEWLTRREITWRTDESNLELDYTRNKLRLELIPYVEREIRPHAGEHMAQTAVRLRRVQEYLDKKAQEAYDCCVCEEGERFRIELDSYWQQEPLMQTMVLQLILKQLDKGLRDIGAVHLEMLEELAGKETGKELSLPYGIRAYREYQALVLEKLERRKGATDGEKQIGLSDKTDRQIPVVVDRIPEIYEINGLHWRFSLEIGKKYQRIPEKTYTKWFDYDRIKKYLCIRTRMPGDFLEINQEHGKKKLKDYLIDCKIPRKERDSQLLLADGQHVLWILGRRISEAYKITEQTERLLRVEVFGGNTDDRENQGDDS